MTVSSSPSGPWTIATPGVSLVNSRKSRPLLGVPSLAMLTRSTDLEGQEHDALYDIQCSIAELSFYRQHLFRL